ncbi:MAG: gluconate 2-dehydrogenase subunit 3 family protein [Vicinamibacterales bacterium]
MAQPAESTDLPAIDRREAIRRAALLAGVVLSPAWLTLVDRARPLAQARYFTPAQLTIAGAIADRIIPRTDTPGAADVGVPAFIDRLYGEFMTEAERRLLTNGLAELEKAAISAHGAPFSTLTAERQDVLLRGIAGAEETRDQSFFRLVRSATVLGYFTSEQVGRNVLHYDPVPGRYEACIPIDQVGRRNWTI